MLKMSQSCGVRNVQIPSSMVSFSAVRSAKMNMFLKRAIGSPPGWPLAARVLHILLGMLRCKPPNWQVFHKSIISRRNMPEVPPLQAITNSESSVSIPEHVGLFLSTARFTLDQSGNPSESFVVWERLKICWQTSKTDVRLLISPGKFLAMLIISRTSG